MVGITELIDVTAPRLVPVGVIEIPRTVISAWSRNRILSVASATGIYCRPL